MNESFVARWRSIIANGGPGKTEVDAEHPLRFIIGVDDRGQPMIFVIVTDRPPVPDLSGVISAERRQRGSDGRWTLALTLTDNRFLEAYLRLVSDLVVRTAHARSEAEGVATMSRIIGEWKRLLARGPRPLLSESALRGLVAELWFGFNVLSEEVSAAEVAQAWQGPFGAHQDYIFSQGPRYEVKSRRPDAQTVRISSPEQFDAPDVSLVACRS